MKKVLISFLLILVTVIVVINGIAIVSISVPNAHADEIVWRWIGEFCMDPLMPCLCPSPHDACLCPVIIPDP
ncbi:hypothetical protein ACFLRX_03685 [Acidobacteriota bacterium]